MTTRRLATMIVRGSLATLVLIGPGCRDDRQPNASKRMPRPPPAERVELPATISLAVTIDGRPAPPITSAMLATHPPDFAERDHRAWQLATLLGDAIHDDTRISAIGAAGHAIELPATPRAGAPVPTLFVTRRGDVILALVDPADPFPDYHGQGRRLGRPGDPLPRITDVVSIELRSAPR